MKVRQLVKLYQQGAGSDDVAFSELQKMGDSARDELIRMLDDPNTSPDDAGAVVMLLFAGFRSEKPIQALERYGAKSGDPRLQDMLRQMREMMKANDPGL